MSTEDNAPQGIVTVTRHPLLSGCALWALAHLVPDGGLAGFFLGGGGVVFCRLQGCSTSISTTKRPWVPNGGRLR
ncbi:MAG: NnrU family protein [Pseudomonadota bacterium]|nr:NnrU family protein [Pseudomonadota bacterium]